MVKFLLGKILKVVHIYQVDHLAMEEFHCLTMEVAAEAVFLLLVVTAVHQYQMSAVLGHYALNIMVDKLMLCGFLVIISKSLVNNISDGWLF